MKTMLAVIIGLLAFPFIANAKHCPIPKKHTVCQRHCCYNYWGPGVHCTERCVTKPVKLIYRNC
jgi:hypothetical protein